MSLAHSLNKRIRTALGEKEVTEELAYWEQRGGSVLFEEFQLVQKRRNLSHSQCIEVLEGLFSSGLILDTDVPRFVEAYGPSKKDQEEEEDESDAKCQRSSKTKQ